MDPVRQHKTGTNASREGIGKAALTTVLVLLTNLPVLVAAIFPFMGDPADSNYSFAREYSWLLSILLLYAGSTLALGLYWQRRYRRTARFIGIIIGILPVLAIASGFAARWILAGSATDIPLPGSE